MFWVDMLLWAVVIALGCFAILLFIGFLLHAFSPPEQKSKMHAEAATMRRPVKERLIEAGHGVDKIYEVRRCGIALDLESQRVVLFNASQPEIAFELISFSDIRGAEVDVVSTQKTVTTGSRSLTGAVLGLAVAGPVGAVIGGTGGKTSSRETGTIHQVQLKIVVDDILRPVVGVPFLKTDWAGLDQNSAIAIPSAHEWHSIIEAIAYRQRASSS